MTRRTKPQAELKPVYVPPTFSRHEREACRAWCDAVFGGALRRPKRGQFDPLYMRVGMRAHLTEARAGWVVSNPLYDETLRRVPALDPSLPGVGWLREVYRWKNRDLVMLPSVLLTLQVSDECKELAAEERAAAAAHQPASQQQELFA